MSDTEQIFEHCGWCNQDYVFLTQSIHCPHDVKPQSSAPGTDIKQLSREAAEKIVDAVECPSCKHHPHRDPCCENCKESREGKERITADIESVLTNSDLFREGYEKAKEDALNVCASYKNETYEIDVCDTAAEVAKEIAALTPDRKE